MNKLFIYSITWMYLRDIMQLGKNTHTISTGRMLYLHNIFQITKLQRFIFLKFYYKIKGDYLLVGVRESDGGAGGRDMTFKVYRTWEIFDVI